jgi:hypothetical protein
MKGKKKSIGEVYANRGRESRMTVSFRAVYALHRCVDVRLAHKEKRKGVKRQYESVQPSVRR